MDIKLPITYLEGEIWKPIPSYDENYYVSNKGRVFSTYKQDLLKPHSTYKHYLSVGLYKSDLKKRKHEFIHRLVLYAFLPNPNNYPQVNHKNGIKTDNRVENLEWCNNEYNQRHASLNGLKASCKGEKNANAKLVADDVIEIRRLYEAGLYNQKELAQIYNVQQAYISYIILGKGWEEVTHSKPVKPLKRKKKDLSTLNDAFLTRIKLGRKCAPKAINQIDIKTGEIVATYRSIKEAEDKTGIAKSSISAVAHHKPFPKKTEGFWYMTQAGGFKWEFVKNQYELYE